MPRALHAIAVTLIALASLSSIYLYTYPFVHQCGFHKPSLSSNASRSQTQDAPFRLLALGDPQLEGDSSFSEQDCITAVWQQFWHAESYENSENLTLLDRLQILFSKSIPRLLQFYRKRLDLLGNDYYLAHIYRTVAYFTAPTHVTVLGDLLGSQWVSDGEFGRRGDRFWRRVFPKGQRVEDYITDGEVTTSLKGTDIQAWRNKIINIVGNHDIGYAGDIQWDNIERFERIFGKVNWETRFSLPGTEGVKEPELRLVILNTLNMDTPVLNQSIQGETYNFINKVITESATVGDNHSAIILLTHVPLHKEAGICADGPMFTFYAPEHDSRLREQNHLSPAASETILEKIYGMSGKENAYMGGIGRSGIILNGHDHVGCDVVHYIPDLPAEAEASEIRTWKASRWHDHVHSPSISATARHIREITVRSMMGDFGGNAGLLSAWYDNDMQQWQFEYSTCSVGKQHLWWAVHILDFVTLIFVMSLIFCKITRQRSAVYVKEKRL